MTKTKYQEAATNHAREYLEQLLKMEDTLGYVLDSHAKDDAKNSMDKKSEKK